MSVNNLNGISNSLALNGVLPYDMEAFLYDKPQKNIKPAQLAADMFNNTQKTEKEVDGKAKNKTKNGWKIFGNLFIAATALTAVIFTAIKCKKLP